ncbi:MAG: HAMP domain-containing histidine kinase [Erysipelotrichia bacterium]|nr:HAMP domain-containing histidine kinase [Erysipelotrichia bacterium]
MNNFSTRDRWWVYAGLLIMIFHAWLGVSLHRLVNSTLAEKADLFLSSLTSSAEQTLQASHYLEERIVDSLKQIAAEIASTPSELLTGEWLETLRQKHDLKAISIYDSRGRVKVSHDMALIGTDMPSDYECHDILQGSRSEHVFGFSEGIFCETDAFGIALRLPGGDVLRLLTGVDFVLGFEKNVGLVSLIARFRQHPGVMRLDLVNISGESMLGETSGDDAPGFSASRDFVLHGIPQGRFEVILVDKDLSDLQKAGFMAILASCFFALLGLKLLNSRIHRYSERLEEQRQIEETRKRIEGLGRVVAAVAHEVRNPLNTITLALNALRYDLEEARSVEKVEPRLKLLEDTVAQADQMVKNLLQASRPIMPQFKQILVPDWFQNIAVTFQSTFAGIKVLVENAAIGEFYADPDLLQRLIWNLFLNAHQAGADTIKIIVCQTTAGTTVDVINNGPPIPEEVCANLFVPGNTSRPEGSGMGLYNCQRICAAHNGTIRALTEEGQVKFNMFFPPKQEKNRFE